jgi:hypothetical protein
MELLTDSMSCCFGGFKPSPQDMSWGLSAHPRQDTTKMKPPAKPFMKIRMLQNHLRAHGYKKADEG